MPKVSLMSEAMVWALTLAASWKTVVSFGPLTDERTGLSPRVGL